jgi:NuA3 HAT complex component NTO1
MRDHRRRPIGPIMFCDGCDLMAHASCYGSPLVQSIRNDDWLCSLCSAKKSKTMVRSSCCLYPSRRGSGRTSRARYSCRRSSSGTPMAATASTAPLCPSIDSPRSATSAREATGARSSAPRPQPKCSRGFYVSCGHDACALSTVRGRAAPSPPASAESTPSSERR